MFNRIRESGPEFLLAIVIFVSCGSYSIYALLKLYPQIFSSNSFNISKISEKTTSFYLNNVQNKCIGSTYITLRTLDQNIDYLVKTKLKVSVDGREDTLDINLQSAFNPLYQMVASVLTINGLESEIIIGILNVNPVELSVSYKKSKITQFKRKISLPGPFMLRQINNELFVEHQPTGKSIPLDLSSALFSLLHLKAFPDSPERPGCPHDSGGILDLSVLSRQLETKLQTINPDFAAELAALTGLGKTPQAK